MTGLLSASARLAILLVPTAGPGKVRQIYYGISPLRERERARKRDPLERMIYI
jgi:hypothetical protein